jgi:hypothetical protein
MDLHE